MSLDGTAGGSRTEGAGIGPRTLVPHPRLFGADLAGVGELISDDARARGWYRHLEDEAQRLLARPSCEYRIPDGRRLLDTSREVLRRTYILALAHRVSGRPEFSDRLWSELQAASRFPDWNPSHFLDVAEMAHAFAIGYDWLYPEWDETQRQHLETAIVTHALRPGLRAYQEAHPWTVRTSNWNLVCNSGLLMAALAVGDAAPGLTDEVIAAAMQSIPRAVAVYGPDGAYPEGLGYWSYGTQYLAHGIEALATATGGPESLSAAPGLERTTSFALHLTGPLGLAFNYYDGEARAARPPAGFWLARRFDDGIAAWWAALGADELLTDWDHLPTSLLWYRPGSGVDPATAGEPLDSTFRGSEVVSMRSAWNQRSAVWVAAKAGNNATPHSDLDLGTFVLDALGTRWLHDLGWDNYSLPGYFDAAGGGRWAYYRKRTEGQNTLVVNPDATGGQSRPQALGDTTGPGTGVVVAQRSSSSEAYAILDLTQAHPSYRSWKRGWHLFDFRRQVLLQDEVTLTEPGEVWSFLHTSAQIAIGKNGRSAVLADGPRRLLVRLLSPTPGRLVEMEAAPLWTSPAPPGQAANAPMRKLALSVQVEGAVTLAVQLSPMANHQPLPPAVSVKPLNGWTLQDHPVAQLESLTVDGAPVPGFSPGVWSYEIQSSRIGKIDAVARASGHIQERREDGGDVLLDVHAPGLTTGTYRLRRQMDCSPGSMTAPIVGSSDDGNEAANAFDGTPDTFWRPSTAGPEWIGCDLGVAAPVNNVLVTWREGARAAVRFDIETAGPDGAWCLAWSGSASGDAGTQRISWPSIEARYLRLVRRDDGPASLVAITAIEVPGRRPLPSQRARNADLTIAVPPLQAGCSRRVAVSVTSPSGDALPPSEYTVELISSDPAVLEVADDRAVARAPGSVTLTALVRTVGHMLLHRSVQVYVGTLT